jgi:hypothetical protein
MNKPASDEQNNSEVKENAFSKSNSTDLPSPNSQVDKMNSELISSNRSLKEHQIDKSADRYPYSIVWTPLPLIT